MASDAVSIAMAISGNPLIKIASFFIINSIERLSTHDTAGFILCGGHSRRMGRDKARLEFQGQPMILHMAALVERVTGVPAVLLGPRERYGEFGLAMVEDDAENAGPLAGLVAMLSSAHAAELNLVLPVDMPDLDAGFVRSWIEALRTNPEAEAAIPVTQDGSAPLAAVYRRRAHAVLAGAFDEGVRRVRTAIERLRCVEIAASRGQLANLNTVEDWAQFPRR